MSPLRNIKAAVAGLVLLAGALALPAIPTSAAIEGTVDIRVELDLPYQDSDGPRVFEVTGVTPGPGPELSEADEIDNPSDWGGGVFVDIDPDTSLITVTPDDAWDFETATVTITATGITGLFTVRDDLWEESDPAMPPVATEVTDSGVIIAWDLGEEGAIDMAEDGEAVFRYFAGTMAVAPIEVETGSPATVSGDGCPTGSVDVVVGDGAATEVAPAADGTWSLEVPTTGLTGAVPVSATCTIGEATFDYAPATLTVTAAQDTTTTTTTPVESTTTEPAGPTGSAAPSAAPASPVRATPSYTG